MLLQSISSKSPFQQLPSTLPVCFGLSCYCIWAADEMQLKTITSLSIKQNSYKRNVAVSEHPFVFLNSLPVLWDFFGSSLKNLPTAPQVSFHHKGPAATWADWPDSGAFDPLRPNPEGHSAVEVTTLSWKPEKPLASTPPQLFSPLSLCLILHLSIPSFSFFHSLWYFWEIFKERLDL